MTRQRPALLAAVTVLAVVVELAGAVGWWGWRRVVSALGLDPVAGARLLADSPLTVWPPAVERARRMPNRQLGEAPDDTVARALTRLSLVQRRWTPGDPRGWVNRARAELIADELGGATADLAAALVRDPTSPQLHRLAALAARASGDNEAALDHLATAAGLGSGDPPAWLELTPDERAWVRLEGLERRLDLYPRTRSANAISLARELRARDRSEEGREVLRRETGDPRVAIELARWDLADDGAVEAERRLTSLAGRRGLPATVLAETWSALAEVRDRRGDAAGARDAATHALGFDPTSASPYRLLAALAERRGDVDEALGLLRRAWGMNPTDVGLLLAVARTAERAGQYDDARIALERAWTVDPTNPGLAATLVEFQLRRGALMDATVSLSEALDRFPTDPRLLRLAERLRAEVNRR